MSLQSRSLQTLQAQANAWPSSADRARPKAHDYLETANSSRAILRTPRGIKIATTSPKIIPRSPPPLRHAFRRVDRPGHWRDLELQVKCNEGQSWVRGCRHQRRVFSVQKPEEARSHIPNASLPGPCVQWHAVVLLTFLQRAVEALASHAPGSWEGDLTAKMTPNSASKEPRKLDAGRSLRLRQIRTGSWPVRNVLQVLGMVIDRLRRPRFRELRFI